MEDKRYYYITPDDYERAEKNGISRKLLNRRVRGSGWDIEKAITKKPGPGGRNCPNSGKWEKWKDRAVVSHAVFLDRLHLKWSEEAAATTQLVEPKDKSRLRGKRKFTDEQLAIAASNGVSYQLLCQRLRSKKRKWTIEKAMTTPPMTRQQIAQTGVKAKRKTDN